jgi:predicted O-methyltransferase YrrM
MRDFLRKARGKTAREFHRLFRNSSELRRLAASSEAGAKIARAVDRTAHGQLEPAEQTAIESVLAQRAAIARDPRPIDEQGHQTTIAGLCAHASRPHVWAVLLFHLLRELRPRRAVEMGTCLGVSGLYQASALALNGDGGTLVTMEAHAERSAVAREAFAKAGLSADFIVGWFKDTLPGVVAGGPVDFAFVDGHHDEHATQDYFRMLLPALPAGGVIVFDDVAWSPGMKRAWRAIRSAPGVAVAVDMFLMGIVVTGDGPRQSFKVAVH